MDWDRVNRENKYRSGGTQKVGGTNAYATKGKKKKKEKKLGFKAKFPGKCPTCKKPITPGQTIVKFAGMPAAVHRRCF